MEVERGPERKTNLEDQEFRYRGVNSTSTYAFQQVTPFRDFFKSLPKPAIGDLFYRRPGRVRSGENSPVQPHQIAVGETERCVAVRPHHRARSLA